MSIFQQERVLHKGNCPGSSVWLEGRYVQLAIVEVTTIHWLYILMICPFWMVKNSRFLLQKRTQIPFLSLRTTPAAWYHWPGFEWDRRCSSTVLRWKNGELSNQKMVTLNHLNPPNFDLWWSFTYTLSQRRHGMSTRCASYTKWAPSRIRFISPIFDRQMYEWKKLHLGENHIAIFENPTYHCITVTAISLIYLWHVGGPRCGVYMSNYIVIYIHVYNYNIMVIYTYIYIYIHICDLFLYVYLPSN